MTHKFTPLSVLIGERIADKRLDRGLAQHQLAKLIGVEHASSISLIEQGYNTPRLTTLYAIAAALECSVYELIPGDWE